MSNSVFNIQVFSLIPSDIPEGVFYLDAQDIDANANPNDDPSNGDPVSEVIDKFLSNTGSQTTVSKQPIFTEKSINNFNGLFFDGIDDILEINDDQSIGSGTGYTQKSFAMVFKTSDDIGGSQIIYEQGGREKGFIFSINSSRLYTGVYNNIDWPVGDQYKILDLGSISVDTAYSLIFVYDSVNDSVRSFLNDVESVELNTNSPQTTNGACPLNGTSFGCNMYVSGGSIGLGAVKNDTIHPVTNVGESLFEGNFFKGYIGEIISWNTALNDTQIQGLIEYNSTKWGFDSITPMITSAFPGSGALLPGGNHTFSYQFNDSHTGSTGIDLNSYNLSIRRWDGSSYGVDISSQVVNSGSVSVTATGASFGINNIEFGRYECSFSISDNSGNTGSVTNVIYIDEPEFIISTSEIDIGSVNPIELGLSDTVEVTVKTVGAGFRVIIQDKDDFVSGGVNLPFWDGSSGYGYSDDPSPTDLTTVSPPSTIATQTASINVNGLKNTYTYNIKLGALVDINQVAGDYLGDIDFRIELDY